MEALLDGKKSIVRTYEHSLKYLLKQREVTLDYQKWLIKTLGYDFDIKYKVGSENMVADGLSRRVHYTFQNNSMLLQSLIIPTMLQLHDLYTEMKKMRRYVY